MKKIAEITPLLFEDHLVISIKKEWLDVWNQIPKLSVYVDGKELVMKTDQKKSTARIE